MNEILMYVTENLENWADEYVPVHKKEILQYIHDDLSKRCQMSYD